jgi:hypothetical protein
MTLNLFQVYKTKLGSSKVELPNRLMKKLDCIDSDRFSRLLHAVLLEIPHELQKDQLEYIVRFDRVFHYQKTTKPYERKRATEDFNSLLRANHEDNILVLNEEETKAYLNTDAKKAEISMISSITYGEDQLIATLDLNFKRILSHPSISRIISSNKTVNKLSKTREYIIHWKISEAQNAGYSHLYLEVEELGDLFSVR